MVVIGSAKGRDGWFAVDEAIIYLDHPYFTPLSHTLNIDFVSRAAGAASRVAVELSPDSARELIARIEAALTAAGELSATNAGGVG
jgi:hypothetical protein